MDGWTFWVWVGGCMVDACVWVGVGWMDDAWVDG